MPISVTCPCGKKLTAPDTLAGKRAKCPACKELVKIPEPLEVIEDEIEFIDDVEVIDEVPLPKPRVAGPKSRAQKIEEYDSEPEDVSDAPGQTALDRKLSGDTQASNPEPDLPPLGVMKFHAPRPKSTSPIATITRVPVG